MTTTTGRHCVFDDGTAITITPLENHKHRVTFTMPNEDGGVTDETCDECPTLAWCEHARRCVRDEAFVTERL